MINQAYNPQPFKKKFKRVFENTSNYRMTVLIALFCLTSCTVMGSKETFVIKDHSSWRTVSQGSQVSYNFKCDKLSINIEEVLVKSTMSAYGPVVPVIPSGKTTDRADQLFELNILVIGEVDEALTNIDKLEVQVIGTNKELYPTTNDLSKVSEQPYNNNLWIQYHFKYGFPQKLKELNNLAIRLQLPFAECNPPELLLERKNISNNEIIMTPGS